MGAYPGGDALRLLRSINAQQAHGRIGSIDAVSPILGITTVEALFLFTSRTSLDGFMEGFLADDEGKGSRQELEAAFGQELKTMAGATADGAPDPRDPVFEPRSLVGVMEGVSSDVRYVALDPDTPRQQV